MILCVDSVCLCYLRRRSTGITGRSGFVTNLQEQIEKHLHGFGQLIVTLREDGQRLAVGGACIVYVM